jgi:LPS-assembly lipoprotein
MRNPRFRNPRSGASRSVRLAAVVALAAVLSACGFHLRGALTLPPDTGEIFVQSRSPYSPLAYSLVEALNRAGAKATAETAAPGMSTLRIRSEQWASTPISIDQFGRAQEFTLRYAVVFSLDKADGSVFVPQQAVELARDYISVPTNSTGTEGERELLAREMRKDMTASILRRIDAAARAPAKAPAAPATDDTGARETLPDSTATP